MPGPNQDPTSYRVGDVIVDTGTRQVTRNGEPLPMPRLSYDLLLALVRNAPNVLTSDELMARVWLGRIVNEETVAKRVELVREALGDDSRQSRYIALVRGHGYRLTAPVEPLQARTQPAPKARAWWIGAALAGAAVLLVASAGLFMAGRHDPAPHAQIGTAGVARKTSLAVLPFDNLSGEVAQEYLAAGMHDALIRDLSKAGALKVISRSSMLRYRDSDKPLAEIAGDLGVDLLMEGSVLRAGDRIRITVQLLDASDATLWAESYEGALRNVLQLQSEVVQAVAQALKVELTPLERTRMTSRREVDLQTYELYLKGAFFLDRMTPEGNETGLALLHRATQLDPADPLPHARLALAYNRIGHAPGAAKSAFPRGTAAALQALGLDDGNAEAHAALAESKLYFHWDWEGAEASFAKALQINPSLAVAHAHYAWLHVIHGRTERALAETKLAIELDPLQPLWPSWHGWIHLWLGDYETAAREQLAALQIDPDFPVAHFVLGQAYAALGRHDEALAAFRKAADRSPRWSWGLGQGYAFAGREAEARAFAASLEQKEQPDPWALAEIYVALGDHDSALRWLERGYEIRRDWMPWIRTNIFFKPLSGEPRFQELVRRLNLPAEAGAT